MATSSRSIELRWLPPALDQQNGIVRRYVINITTTESSTTVVLYSTSPNISVNHLTPFTTYSCAIAAETVATGPFTEFTEVTTPEDGEFTTN